MDSNAGTWHLEGKMITKTYQECLQGRITPHYAVQEIDRELDGITAVFYTPQKLVIQNHKRRESMDTRDKGKKVVRLREQLAILCYMKAQQNGSRLPGEMHISREASTMHHKQGIERMLKGM